MKDCVRSEINMKAVVVTCNTYKSLSIRFNSRDSSVYAPAGKSD